MRFRPKLSAPWLLILLFASVFLSIFNIRHLPPVWIAIFISCFALLTLLTVVAFFSIYWELDSTNLRYRWLWKKKEIAWPDVRSVGKLGYFNDNVSIRYGHSIEDYGCLYTNPSNRDAFLEALHQFAPHATFDE